MRKRTIAEIADTLLWYAIYMLPTILLIATFAIDFNGHSVENWEFIYGGFFNSVCIVDNPIYSVLSELFTNVITLFDGTGDYGYFVICQSTWFVTVYLIHLCVDFLLFIPRLCHKWMSKCTQND